MPKMASLLEQCFCPFDRPSQVVLPVRSKIERLSSTLFGLMSKMGPFCVLSNSLLPKLCWYSKIFITCKPFSDLVCESSRQLELTLRICENMFIFKCTKSRWSEANQILFDSCFDMIEIFP